MTRIHDLPDAIADAVEAGLPAIRAFRVQADLSLAQLARSASMDPHRLASIEAGSRLKDEEADALGLALDVPPHLLIDS